MEPRLVCLLGLVHWSLFLCREFFFFFFHRARRGQHQHQSHGLSRESPAGMFTPGRSLVWRSGACLCMRKLITVMALIAGLADGFPGKSKVPTTINMELLFCFDKSQLLQSKQSCVSATRNFCLTDNTDVQFQRNVIKFIVPSTDFQKLPQPFHANKLLFSKWLSSTYSGIR